MEVIHQKNNLKSNFDLELFFKKQKIDFVKNKSIKTLTSFKIGGECAYCCYPKSKKQLLILVKNFLKFDVKFYILGNGTNVLASDDFYDGVIVSTTKCNKIKISGTTAICECGVNLFNLNKLLCEKSLSGFEFSYGIPGTIGGAVIQNAGAYGGEIGDRVRWVEYFDGKKIKKISGKNAKFVYRNSVFSKMLNCVILQASFSFFKGDKGKIKELMFDYLQKRKTNQPYGTANAGSIFKRIDGIIVSKAIDNLGLKGYSLNNAEISKIHAGFIVNKSNATCKDVLKLIDIVKAKFFEKYQKELELEIHLLR